MRPWATWRSMVSSKNWQNAFGPCWGGVRSVISTRRESLPWEPTFPSFFEGYNPYTGGLKPSFFMGTWGPKVVGGNSNMFYFHPENWGRFSTILTIYMIFFKGVGEKTTNQVWFGVLFAVFYTIQKSFPFCLIPWVVCFPAVPTFSLAEPSGWSRKIPRSSSVNSCTSEKTPWM